MLLELSIRDLALIEAVELSLDPGLDVVSGETGAGKTLFVGALELLLGESPRGGAASWVRKGAAEARVEGRFVVRGAEAIEELFLALEAEAPAIAEDWRRAVEGDEAELFLGRTLTKESRTRAHVNQRPVPLRVLRAVAPLLIEIHGQNDHQRLLEPDEQLRLLDAFGELGPALARYREARATWSALRERLQRFEAARAERRDRFDLASFQAEELEEARLEEGEHARLAGERELLRSAGELRHELGGHHRALVESEGATLELLRSAVRSVERWREKLPALDGPLEDLRAAEVHVDEAGAALASLLDEVEDDPARLEHAEERLAELERLEHKYGKDEAGLIEHLAVLRAELSELEEADEGRAELSARVAEARQALEAVAHDLTEARRALAPRLEREVEATLGALGLGKARFGVELRPRDDPEDVARFGPDGAEGVELLLAANPGEETKPLRRVASGGETARIMLALRTVLRGGGRTLVFDEIDAGVGGRLGPEVGRHLRGLGRGDQVLCVTHLPAITAAADQHLKVEKRVSRGRTRTSIARLEGEARVAEIADMIGGGADEDTARAEARRLLDELHEPEPLLPSDA